MRGFLICNNSEWFRRNKTRYLLAPSHISIAFCPAPDVRAARLGKAYPSPISTRHRTLSPVSVRISPSTNPQILFIKSLVPIASLHFFFQSLREIFGPSKYFETLIIKKVAQGYSNDRWQSPDSPYLDITIDPLPLGSLLQPAYPSPTITSNVLYLQFLALTIWHICMDLISR